jgi:hypothetical protein
VLIDGRYSWPPQNDICSGIVILSEAKNLKPRRGDIYVAQGNALGNKYPHAHGE